MGISLKLLFALTLAVLSGLVWQFLMTSMATKPQSIVDRLWGETVVEYLKAPLWTSEFNYDAAHLLMPPLHCAYLTCPGDQSSKKEDFDRFFQRFANHITQPLDSNPLREAQFLYLVSQYLLLSQKSSDWSDSKTELRKTLESLLEALWLHRAAPHWAYSSNFSSARKRLLWKLHPTKNQYRYFAAVVDEEYFILAIAADLRALSVLQKRQMSDLVIDIGQVGWAVMQQGSFSKEGHWLMQPGVWADHKDYRYAGHERLEVDLKPKVVTGLAMDSSHSHRMGLWLMSMMEGAVSSERHSYYQKALQGFRTQWLDFAYRSPGSAYPWPSLTNYLDGHNGVYRYGYSTLKGSQGYGPYQLSYALFVGWYALAVPEATEGYQWLSNHFPLSDAAVSFYLGPDTSRRRHSLIESERFYTNGFAELLVNIGLLSSARGDF